MIHKNFGNGAFSCAGLTGQANYNSVMFSVHKRITSNPEARISLL